MEIIEEKINENVVRTNADLAEIRRYLVRHLEGLSKQTKLVLSFYYIEELTFKEIGKVMNLPEAEVLQIYLQAIKLLRTFLRKEGFV